MEVGKKWAAPVEGHRTSVVGGGAGSELIFISISYRAYVSEWSLFEVGISPPHALDIPQGLLASNTHTDIIQHAYNMNTFIQHTYNTNTLIQHGTHNTIIQHITCNTKHKTQE